jgi:demethylmenaquinone methyltransferase/2-methoxy-6-polyprenyl-1,4-benzoquinol methylase
MARRAPSEDRIEAMFDAVAPRYDLLNDAISLGLDRYWWRAVAGALGTPPGGRVLDLGCGTGRLAARLSGRYRVVGIDVSRAMLAAARSRVGHRAQLVRGSAFRLPFADSTFDGIASAFVLRNLDDLAAAFVELARVLAPGAALAVLDITEPRHPLLRLAFGAYFGTVAPALGRMAGQPDAYRYLVDSLAQLPPPGEVCRLLRSAEFARCSSRSLFPGAVTLWTARRHGP